MAPTFTRDLDGRTPTEVVSDELAPYYRSRGYVEVVDVEGNLVPVNEAAAVRAALEERHEVEQQVAELAGPRLAAAAKKAGLPSNLKADETRAALVDAKAPEVPDYDDEPTAPDATPTLKES